MMKKQYDAPEAKAMLFASSQSLALINLDDLQIAGGGPGNAATPSDSDIKIEL